MVAAPPQLSWDELQICQRLARHLTDALRLQRDRLAHARHMLPGSELLARLRACVVLIDEERRLLHVNQAASSLLGSSDVMAQSDDRLFCRRTIDDNALAMGLRELLRENRSAVEALLRSHDQRARKGRSAVTRTRRHVS